MIVFDVIVQIIFRSMSKRRFNPSLDEDKTPIVEKLYKANQPSFHGAGGFCDDDDEAQERREQISDAKQKRFDAASGLGEMPDNCSLCEKPLIDSWLWERYGHPVCDSCRDDKGEHKLIAKTEAKNEFLLRDYDFDNRKPPLRFYAKKNPHNPRYGDMKLYLRSQVVSRMLEIHGSWENLADEKTKRVTQRETRAEKNFEKKVKEMRQHIRGLNAPKLTQVNTKAHEHDYGPEEYDEVKDVYSKKCYECDYVNTYEKL